MISRRRRREGMAVTMLGAEHQWLVEFTRLMMTTALHQLKGELGGFALQRDGTQFTYFAVSGKANCLEEGVLVFPPLFLQHVSSSPTVLQFPNTSFLPVYPPPASALVARVGEERKPLLVWIGRFHPSPWTDHDIHCFATFGRGLYRLLLPFLPLLTNGNFLRSWLEVSAAPEASQWLEESMLFLLHLLCQSARIDNAAIAFYNREGEVLFGVAQGEEGKQWLTYPLPTLLAHAPSLIVRTFGNEGWMGAIVLKVSSPSPSLFPWLNLFVQALQSLILWGQQVSHLGALSQVVDPLTNLPTRESLRRKVANELKRSIRFAYPLSLLVLDLDRFSLLNETLGYEIGDRILKQVGTALRQLVRGYDVVARYGGDEFAVVLPATSVEGALVVAQRLRDRIATTTSLPFKEVLFPLQLSIGVTSVRRGRAADAQQLLSLAEQAMITAKQKGGNRVEVMLPPDQPHKPPALTPIVPDTWSALVEYLSHNINNPLNGILGLTQIALMEEQLPPTIREALTQIEKQALRLRDFSRHLATLSSQQVSRELEKILEKASRKPSFGDDQRGSS